LLRDSAVYGRRGIALRNLCLS